jgi:lipopolysaccharide heptosyltransferase II
VFAVDSTVWPNMKKFATSLYLHLRWALLIAAACVLRRRCRRSADASLPPRNILFIRVDRIGDMVVSTPALRAIKRSSPGAHLTVLASRSNAQLLRHDPHVDRVLVWDGVRPLGSPIGFLHRANRLARARFDAVIDPMTGHDLRTALIAWLSRAPMRIGYAGYGREVFFSHICRPGGDRLMVDLILDLTYILGARPDGGTPQLRLLPIELEQARCRLTSSGSAGRPLVAIHPGAHYPSQRWPADYFARMAQHLQRDHACRVILLGGPEDGTLIKRIQASAAMDLAAFERLDVRQTAAMIAQADVLVCNNSGPLHLAAALGTPTLSFMGPTDRDRWMPAGPGHVVLRQDRLDCIGCNQGTCPRGDHACMRMTTPDTALARLRPLLFRGAATSEPREGGVLLT